jgi:hypothetical protein
MRYLAMLAATTTACLAVALVFNSLVDPLWYFSGNRFGPVNYAFNERLSKSNLISGHEREYDCVIFGDSRVTLLPEQEITGYRCFNFAFSSGVVSEFIDYAQWLKMRGLSPRLVIVGVSAGDFRKRKMPHNVPDFVMKGKNPPSPLLEYLSLDVLGMSWRSLFGTSPIDRNYDRDFRCQVAVTTPYNPAKPIRDLYSGPFDDREPLTLYGRLRSIFPQARFVGYAPPLSAWAIAEYERIGWLPSYTRAFDDASTVFDRFVDYSPPSALTMDPGNTYDGTHYSEKVNSIIAASLPDRQARMGLDLTALTNAQILEVYRRRLREYSSALAAGAGGPHGRPPAVPTSPAR